MADRVLDDPWIAAPATRAVMDALEAKGGADCARFVGGSVRNALMGLGVDDIDIATRLPPEDVVQALKAAGLKSVPTGIEHGTVTAIAAGRPFEITTLRRDVETDGRHAVVAFTDDWREDALRRDFHLNALYADRAGKVFDPTGEGVADALAGRVVFVGEPLTRLAEDYLRILRFFRFQAWYGRGEPDAPALAACEAMRERLAGLAAERIGKEMLKLLAAPHPVPAIGLMARTGVLAQILPEAADTARLSAVAAIDGDPILRLASLLPPGPEGAQAAPRRLRLSNAQRDRLVLALADQDIVGDMGAKAARAAIYRLGWTTFRDRMILASGASPLLADLQPWQPPLLPVSGADAMAAGIEKGPGVGAALRDVETWWIEGDFAADRAALLARLKALP